MHDHKSGATQLNEFKTCKTVDLFSFFSFSSFSAMHADSIALSIFSALNLGAAIAIARYLACFLFDMKDHVNKTTGCQNRPQSVVHFFSLHCSFPWLMVIKMRQIVTRLLCNGLKPYQHYSPICSQFKCSCVGNVWRSASASQKLLHTFVSSSFQVIFGTRHTNTICVSMNFHHHEYANENGIEREHQSKYNIKCIEKKLL